MLGSFQRDYSGPHIQWRGMICDILEAHVPQATQWEITGWDKAYSTFKVVSTSIGNFLNFACPCGSRGRVMPKTIVFLASTSEVLR